MPIDTTTIIGLTAAVLTTTAFVPQVVKTWRTRSAGDLSLAMFSMMFLGTFLWLVYGLYRDDLPVMLANAVAFCLLGVILFFKLKETKQRKQ